MNTLIVLISGTGLRSDLRFINYWGEAPDVLKRYGFEVLMIHPDAFGSISKNVEIIAGELSKVLTCIIHKPQISSKFASQ